MPTTQATLDTDTANRLRLAVMRLARRMRQHADTHSSPSQLSALSTLDRTGPIPLGELAAIEQIGPSTTTRIVACLEERGFVQRTTDPTDRRVVLVSVTRKGRRFLDRARSKASGYLAERMTDLSAADRKALARALPVLERLLAGAPVSEAQVRGTPE
ncbi:MAG: MarR family winged helix-turn-helix transcriptional regulator [Egibacteraceae bacterium]